MAEIDSPPISEMANASSDDLLEELRVKRATATLAPWVIGTYGVVLYLLFSSRDVGPMAGGSEVWSPAAVGTSRNRPAG